ncbi:MAG TPA: NAD(P)H-binding protein [Kofleriaceae bacterium]|nr:NAD(P)H-binding protein [Kofleriaceae bacterium]
MTAFVLGATGFVGREVVRQLAVRATPVVAHVRPKSAAEWAPKLEALGAKVDQSEWDAAALSAAIDAAGAQQLYILIGTTRSRAKAESVDGDIYEKIDYGLTRIAVDAALGSKAKPRLVYLSGLGADANARGAYMKARGKAEDAVRSSGLQWVIARPAIITGERDESRPGERAGAIVGDGLLAVAGLFSKNLRDKYRSTTPDVLASALIRIGEGSEHDRVFDGPALR